MPDNIEIIENLDTVVIQEVAPDSVILASPVAIGGGGGPGGGSGITLGEPRSTILVAPNLSPGNSLDLDADPITSFFVGRLWAVSIQSSVSLRCDVELVNGSRSIYDTLYKKAGDPQNWFAPDPRFFQATGDGITKYGVTVYNLSPINSADMH